MIEFIKYIIIGLIQGITEVLPVSSSGHLTIVEHMMGINNDNLAFEVFLHLASFIAVIAFLYKPLIKIIKSGLRQCVSPLIHIWDAMMKLFFHSSS